ncbi:MAG: hypothetical protein O3A63_12580 [Proteobacteria bacterium]|nr:hypothetical protein [Pseudomonadota bacterium]
MAIADIEPDRTYMVFSGEDSYPINHDVQAIGLRMLIDQLSAVAEPATSG